MFTPLPTARRRPTRPLLLASALLPLCLGQAAAQGLQQRAGAWAATPHARGDEAAAAPSFEVTAVRSGLHGPAAPHAGQQGSAGGEMAGVNYRMWMTHGRADIGVGLGSLGYVVPASDGFSTVTGSVPTVTLGVRVRMSDQHMFFADASGARGLGADPAATYVNTTVGVEWKPARSTLGFEHGALGVQLDSGFRLSLKSRRGGPMLYLRNTF